MKYWVYMNGEVPGCYPPPDLVALTGFTMTTLVCPAEGEILEKNWRRSGEFPDIIKVLHERDAQKPPSAPTLAQESVMTGDVNQLIDTASGRLFSHVAELMKELENRREERALTLSVQRQLVDLKDQLQQTREKNAQLESRIPRISELEESMRKDQDRIDLLETSLKAREEGLGELRVQLEKSRTDLESSRRRLGEAINDLAIRNRLVDKLSRDLTEKELSLAKSLGVIRRLEEDLHRLVPTSGAALDSADAESLTDSADGPASALGPLDSAPALAAQDSAGPEESAAYTSDDPAPGQVPAPPGAPAAQTAIVDLFKRFINKDMHS